MTIVVTGLFLLAAFGWLIDIPRAERRARREDLLSPPPKKDRGDVWFFGWDYW